MLALPADLVASLDGGDRHDLPAVLDEDPELAGACEQQRVEALAQAREDRRPGVALDLRAGPGADPAEARLGEDPGRAGAVEQVELDKRRVVDRHRRLADLPARTAGPLEDQDRELRRHLLDQRREAGPRRAGADDHAVDWAFGPGRPTLLAMLNDTSVKLLAGIGVALYLGAPALGWVLDEMRWPISAVVIATGVLTLAAIALERPQLDLAWAALVVLQLLAVGGGTWWLLAPARPAAVLTWVCYGLGLAWLSGLLAFMLVFRLNRLW